MMGRRVVAVLVALVLPLVGAGCGKRYVPGVPLQTRTAYEMAEALTLLRDVQAKVIALVDAGQTTPALADRVLVPIRQAATLAQTQIVPKLEAYDTAATLATREALKGEITPLLIEFNGVVGRIVGAQLPANLAAAIGNLADAIRRAFATVRLEFKEAA